MAQMHERFCPNCGSPVAADQRFCSNCGQTMDSVQPTPPPPPQQPMQYPQQQQGAQRPQPPQPPQQFQQQQAPPPGPYYPPAPQVNRQVPSYAQGQQQQQQQSKQGPIAEAFAALGLLFLLRRSTREAFRGRQRRSNGCCGFLVFVVIIVIFAAIGIGIYRSVGNSVRNATNGVNNSGGGSGSSNGNGNDQSTGPSTITTMQINQMVTYASVDITIANVQQSLSFKDDPQSQTNGLVRLNFHEKGPSSGGNFLYGDVARLILPDQSVVTPNNELQDVNAANGVSRDNWIDFPVPTSDKISQLTLQLGTASEAQILVPLTGKADLTQYQVKTVNPNTPISYAGLNWTLKTASRMMSADGKQATTGMRYIVLTFNVDNPSTNNVVTGFTDTYMRLKSGDTTNPALSTTLPLTINAKSSGASGTVTFLMPENSTAFTLIMLTDGETGGTQTMSDFQLA